MSCAPYLARREAEQHYLKIAGIYDYFIPSILSRMMGIGNHFPRGNRLKGHSAEFRKNLVCWKNWL
jgi:hypothetical protein